MDEASIASVLKETLIIACFASFSMMPGEPDSILTIAAGDGFGKLHLCHMVTTPSKSALLDSVVCKRFFTGERSFKRVNDKKYTNSCMFCITFHDARCA